MRAGSDGPFRLRLVDRAGARLAAGRRGVDRVDPDERVLGRGRVGVRVATPGA